MLFQGLGKRSRSPGSSAPGSEKKGSGRNGDFQAQSMAGSPELEDEISLLAVIDILYPASLYFIVDFCCQGSEKKAI